MSPSAISTTSGASSTHSNRRPSLESQLNGLHLDSPNPTNGHTVTTTASSTSSPILDLLCIGFGPASLAIAIALHDAQEASPQTLAPQTLFLEKQPRFAWHAGMQLPNTKMQISFMKDLATPRCPRSQFTFVNYLFTQKRLNQFINLGTFLPTRLEYEDYLRWCAAAFEGEGKVRYGMDVGAVRVGGQDERGKVTSWEVEARNGNGDVVIHRARHVVIAVGGRAVVPENLQGLKHVAHSSQFANTIPRIQEREGSAGRTLRFAVVGSGQSAAEIFSDLWERFPTAQVKLIIKSASLRPSDDSPL